MARIANTTRSKAPAKLTLTPNGGGAVRTYDVAFSIGASTPTAVPVTLLLRSSNGTFRVAGSVPPSSVGNLPTTTFATLDPFARRFVGRSSGTLDIPRHAGAEGDADIVFTEDGLFQLLEPRGGGGYVLTDRGAWSAAPGTSADRGTLTLVGNMGSGTRVYDVRIGTENGRTVAVLRGAAGAFVISFR